MENIVMAVSKKESGKHVQVGSVSITVPTLEDLIPHMGAKVTGKEDGLPVYDSDIANWLQSSMLAYCKAAARNKVKPGTAEVKDGLKIATNWEELCAEGERGGNAAGLAIFREAKQAFADWVAKLGKSEAATQTLITLFSNKQALLTQSAANKAKMADYVTKFAESLAEEALERFERPISSVLENCAATTEADDF